MPRNFYEGILGAPVNNVYTIYPGAQVGVYDRGTNNLSLIYQAETGNAQGPSPAAGAAGTNPFTVGASGSIQFWAERGRYDIKLHDLQAPARFSDRTVQWQSVPLDGIDETLMVQTVLDAWVPIGAQLPYGGSSDPSGGRYLLCDGRLVSIASYPLAYAAIGHRYNGGADPGSGQFKLPDKRGRTSMGADNMGTARGAAGVITTLAKTVGSRVGSEQAVLDVNQLPAHAHSDGTLATVPHTHTDTFEAPAHTHTIAHTHTFSGSTGTESADHTHAITVAAANYGSYPYVPSSNVAWSADTSGALGGTGNKYPGHVQSGLDSYLNMTHGHTASAGGRSAAHTHAYNGTTSGASTASSGPATSTALVGSVDQAPAVDVTGATGSVGAGNPITNMQPAEVDNWIIRVR